MRRKSHEAMLSMLPLVFVLAGGPAASPSPPPTKLQEIGRVRASICTSLVVHANGAIAQALDNDRTLAILETNLRTIDFDKFNELERRNSIDALMKQTQTVRANFRGADGEIKTLRRLAAESADPQRKQELKTFADALGGALARQNKAAAEFDRGVVVLRGREEASEARAIERRDQRMAVGGRVPPGTLARHDAIVDSNSVPPPPGVGEWDRAMRQIADELDRALPAIAFDEGAAADHSIAATTGC